MQAKRSGSIQLVFPGSVLCTEEEFAPGSNTGLDEEGNVLSVSTGVPVFDSNRRTVSVEKKGRNIQPLQPGATLIGKVVLVKDNAAVIEAISAFKNNAEMVVPNATIAIPVSRMDQFFVESAKQKFKAGDIVVAIVEKVFSWGIDLNTASPQFGVLKSFCSNCRTPLMMDGGQLKCPECKRIETRKMSSAYELK